MTMAVETKPLHVRVAEALGCKLRLMHQTPVELGDFWVCGCHATKEVHGYGLEMYHYDTDWSATGPLIERYKIALLHPGEWLVEPDTNVRDWVAATKFSSSSDDGYDAEAYGYSRTPLIAVCNLILALKEAGKL